MSIIVLHEPSNKKYILLGTGFGAYKAQRPSILGGNLFPHEEAGEIPVAAVCDENGVIQWFYTEELKVLEINGYAINLFKDRLRNDSSRQKDEEEAYEQCPGCNEKVRNTDYECPSCGLTLIDKE